MCIFLWFAMLIMILILAFDLLTDIEDIKIVSEALYWLFYIFGIVIINHIKAYMVNGNFTVIAKIISIIRSMAISMLIFIGI